MDSGTEPFNKPLGLQPFLPSGRETDKVVDWWGKVVFFLLCVAVGLLGVGRLPIPFFGGSFSSWSVSRTVFFSWLIWKILLWVRFGRYRVEWQKILPPLPLLLFFAFVTASLLPDFRHWQDYRYFLFAFFHYLMVVDVFSQGSRPRLLLLLLGIAPGFLFLRGVLADPSVLSLNQVVRFGFPLDHPNTAGYVFSMAIPLSLAVVVNEKRWLRGLSGVSLGAQFVGLILTYSRGAWIGCLASLLGLGVGEKRMRKIISVLGLIGFAVLVMSSPLRSRLTSLGGGLDDPYVLWRFQVMANAVSLGLDTPFLGVGYGRRHLRAALSEKYPEFVKQRYVHHSHNVYTELVSGTGFLGLSAFLWLLGSTVSRLLWKARRDSVANRPLYFCLVASLVAFMVSGLGDVPFYHHETRIYFFTLLGLIYLHLQKADVSTPRNADFGSVFPERKALAFGRGKI